MEKSEWIWMNGEIVPWEDAQVHVLSHGLHYGTGVFEGIRCYATDRGPAVFRHRDHLTRLAKSAELYYLPLPYAVGELRDATCELIRRNGLESCYIRPIAFRGYGEMGLYAQSAPIDVMIAVWPWGAYLGEEGKRNGVRAKVSSWRRISPDGLIPEAKACGQYLNSILAKNASVEAGYDEAIVLTIDGHVSEGSAENLFMYKDGVFVTPPVTDDILEGVTRQLIMGMIREELGKTVIERSIDRTELYTCEELLLCGTGAQISPVVEVDRRVVGNGRVGEFTQELQSIYFGAVRGESPKHKDWTIPVY